MRIINTPLNDLFLGFVRSSRKSIKLCSPFVKKQSVTELLENMNDNVSLSLITNINLQNFYRSASDIVALEMVSENGGIIYNYQRLHAKIYIFDDAYSIITSANLTPSGLKRNYEYGIGISDRELVDQVCDDYNRICCNEDVATISDQHISTIKNILVGLPKTEIAQLLVSDLETDEVTDAVIDKALIEKNRYLSGWKRDLFEQLSLLDIQTFTRQDYLPMIPVLQQRHPENNHIEAKIRQVLQRLRNIGLIKFEENGVYTKLWQ